MHRPDKLTPCASCGCHHGAGQATCPHCGARRATTAAGLPVLPAAALAMGLAAATGLSCTGAAKYGGGDSWDSGVADADHDGWDASEDCDESNSDVNPGAAEVCENGVDDDCDGDTDDDDADCAE